MPWLRKLGKLWPLSLWQREPDNSLPSACNYVEIDITCVQPVGQSTTARNIDKSSIRASYDVQMTENTIQQGWLAKEAGFNHLPLLESMVIMKWNLKGMGCHFKTLHRVVEGHMPVAIVLYHNRPAGFPDEISILEQSVMNWLERREQESAPEREKSRFWIIRKASTFPRQSRPKREKKVDTWPSMSTVKKPSYVPEVEEDYFCVPRTFSLTGVPEAEALLQPGPSCQTRQDFTLPPQTSESWQGSPQSALREEKSRGKLDTTPVQHQNESLMEDQPASIFQQPSGFLDWESGNHEQAAVEHEIVTVPSTTIENSGTGFENLTSWRDFGGHEVSGVGTHLLDNVQHSAVLAPANEQPVSRLRSGILELNGQDLSRRADAGRVTSTPLLTPFTCSTMEPENNAQTSVHVLPGIKNGDFEKDASLEIDPGPSLLMHQSPLPRDPLTIEYQPQENAVQHQDTATSASSISRPTSPSDEALPTSTAPSTIEYLSLFNIGQRNPLPDPEDENSNHELVECQHRGSKRETPRLETISSFSSSHSESDHPDNHWTWDETEQNYYHTRIAEDGREVTRWYPREFS